LGCQPLLREASVLRLERTSKLLAGSFDEGIISARWFVGFVTWELNSAEVLSDADEDGRG
jgi:hypothetical protein